MKKVLITGTSSGLGKHLKSIYEKTHSVISLDRPKFDFKTRDFISKVDLSVNYDIVIINAVTRAQDENNDWSTVMNVNFINQTHLVFALKNNIKSKLVFISSRSGSHENYSKRNLDRFSYPSIAYKASKAALNISMTYFSKLLSIPVISIHPGNISFKRLAPVGESSVIPMSFATNIAKLINTVSIDDTGKYFNHDGSERTSI